MKTQQIIGLALTAAGAVDFLAAYTLVGPRIKDERQRSLVTRALTASSLALCGLGLALFYGLIG